MTVCSRDCKFVSLADCIALHSSKRPNRALWSDHIPDVIWIDTEAVNDLHVTVC